MAWGADVPDVAEPDLAIADQARLAPRRSMAASSAS